MSISSQYPYQHDILSIKQYGYSHAKVSYHSSCRTSGFEDNNRKFSPKGSVNDTKLYNNLCRTKELIREKGLCNPWQFFCTLTIDPKLHEKFNLKSIQCDISNFIHNQNRRRDDKISYLLIPEMCKDGAWHFHGFLNGLRDSDLSINKYGYLTWDRYNEKFGYVNMQKIDNQLAMVLYCLKYITKDCQKSVTELGARMFFASKGLKGAKQVYKGQGVFHGNWGWEHPDGWCKTVMLDLSEITLEECIEVL